MSELPDFTVRRAAVADIPALVELRIAFDHEMAGRALIGSDDERRARNGAYLRAHVPDESYRAWVADAAGVLVGMAGMVVIDRPPHPASPRRLEAMVFNVITIAPWRLRGVGRAVMEAVIADGRALGCRRVMLRTSRAGSHLYAALGFADPGNWRQLDLD